MVAHAARRKSRPFLIAPETGRTYTYADLARQSSRWANALAARGLEPGDTVGTLLHNGWQTATTLLGTMAGGYTCAPFNLLAQRSQLAYVIEHSECKLIVTSREYEQQLVDAMKDVKRPVAIEVIDVDAPELFAEMEAPPAGEARIAGDTPALLMYTSGTTGKPKGALLTHANLLASAHAVASWHRLTARDRVLSSLPLYHINGQVIATIVPFLSGGSIIAPHRFSVGNWWQMVKWHQPTWLNLVPTIIAYLLNAAEPGHHYLYPNVRFGRSASAPLPTHHWPLPLPGSDLRIRGRSTLGRLLPLRKLPAPYLLHAGDICWRSIQTVPLHARHARHLHVVARSYAQLLWPLRIADELCGLAIPWRNPSLHRHINGPVGLRSHLACACDRAVGLV